MRSIVAVAILLSAVSCGSGSASSPSPSSSSLEEKGRRFTLAMESNDVELSGLQNETARRAGPSAYRERLARIRENMVQAAGLGVMNIDTGSSALAGEAESFIALLDELDEDPWRDEQAAGHYRRVERACNDCHAKFREDK